MEFEEPDPADALRTVLSERERAKKAVYKQAMAREAAEEAAAHAEKMFQMQIEEVQKLALENATLRRDKEELEKKLDCAVTGISIQTLKLTKLQKRYNDLSILVADTQRKLYEASAVEKEDEPVENPMLASDESGMTVKEVDDYLEKTLPGIAVADPHEGPHGWDETVGPGKWARAHPPEFGLLRVAKTLMRIAEAEAFVKKPFVLVTLVSMPFLIMTFFNALVLVGIKVQFVADLIAPLWQPWMNGLLFPWVSAVIPVLLYSALLFSGRLVSAESESTGVDVMPDGKVVPDAPPVPPEETEDNDEYLKQIDLLFGDDDAT